MRRKRLYGHLMLVISIILATTFIAGSWFTARNQSSYVLNNLLSHSETISGNLAIICSKNIIVSDYAGIEAIILRFAQFPDILEIQVCEPNGKILSDVIHPPGSPPKVRFQSGILTPPSAVEKSVTIDGQNLIGWQPVYAEAHVGWVRIVHSTQDMRAMQKIVWKNSLLTGMIGILFSVAACLIVLRPPTIAIRNATDFAKGLDAEKGKTIPVQRDFVEIEELCKALNDTSLKLFSSEKALVEHRDRLEETVASRTAELGRTNVLLQRELEEREQAEANLLKEKNFSEGLIRSLPGILLVFDEGGKFIRWNRNLEVVSGYDGDELARLTLFDLIAMNDRKAVADKIEETFARGASEVEALIVMKNGDQVPHFLSGSKISVDTKGCIIGIGIDIAERKRIMHELEKAYADLKATQAQMLQSEKMASIGQLAAGVAHEINNPVGFVSSNLKTLEKYLGRIAEFLKAQDEGIAALAAPDLAEDLRLKRKSLKIDYILHDTQQLIRESSEGTDRVGKIVHDLKSFSRLDEAEYKLADINECLETTLNIVWNEIKYKAELKRDYGEIPLTCCFPQQLNQVFVNLLVNACQAMDQKGEITVRTRREGNFITVSVSDTGCGIPEEHLSRLFEPFFTTKDVGKGTGLGLSVSYDIVKKHNGEIRVESQVGRGTTFTVSIPVVDFA